MRKALLALPLLTLALHGCGNYSNEDIAFLDALPDKAALQVNVPSQSGALQSGDASLHVLTVETAQGINQAVDGILLLIDKVRTIPPSKRAPTSRTWGPFADDKHKDFENQFTLTRVTDHYAFAFSQRKKGQGDFVPVLTGTFFTQSAHKGHGTLTLDNTAFEQIGHAPDDPNLLRIDVVYANDTSPRSVNTTLHALDPKHDNQPVTATWEYTENPDHSGRVVYDLLDDFDPANANGQEHVHAISRWVASGAGRSDAIVDQGAVAASCGDSGADLAQQCWDAQFGETYFDDTLEGCLFSPTPGVFCSNLRNDCDGGVSGDSNSCVLPPENP